MEELTKLNQLQAHWLYIPHNVRNNKRTEPQRKKK